MIGVTAGEDHVAVVEIRRPPNNFIDPDLLCALADTYDELDADDRCRVVLLCAAGRHFSAGRNFAQGGPRDSVRSDTDPTVHLYDHALRLFQNRKVSK